MAYDNLMTFSFTRNEEIMRRTGSEGFQPKFISADGLYFVKTQCLLGGTYMQDWKVEYIASILCEHFGVKHIEQIPCIVVIDGRVSYGVASHNLCIDGYKFESFESIINSVGFNSNDAWFVKADAIGKIKGMADAVSKATKIDCASIERYMVECALMDILVYNNDRHMRNYSVLWRTDGNVTLAPLYDFGMGLFEHDPSFKDCSTWQECDRYSYVAPYGEGAFELLAMLDEQYGVLKWFRRYAAPVVDVELFPSRKAYDYFSELVSQIWR